jgi:hypothetical protein
MRENGARTQSFFDVYGGPERNVLNTLAWLKNTPRRNYPEPIVVPFPKKDHRWINVVNVEDETNLWRLSTKSLGRASEYIL